MNKPAIHLEGLMHRFGDRTALTQINLDVEEGGMFGVLGPNGGGKTTLFRILATLFRPTAGKALVLGYDVVRDADQVRRQIGVVFQSPSLDKKLTVRENMLAQGHMYGRYGRMLREDVDHSLKLVRLYDRKNDLVETLSGGLARRAELAKCLLHRPRLLLLDEPTTGLDPAIRREFWQMLAELGQKNRMTTVMTTHLMDEAEMCDRVAILHEGKIVALDTPSNLKKECPNDVVSLETVNPRDLASKIEKQFGLKATLVNGGIRLEHKDGSKLVTDLMKTMSVDISSVTLRKATLEDVFVQRTGREFVTHA